MSRFRFPLRRLAGGLLFSALLFGCDTRTPLEVPDTSQQARGSVVQDQVSQAAKEAAMRGQGSIGGRLPAVSPLFYNVEQIPFQPGPTNVANLGPVCDDCVMNDVPIGFNFWFYGQFYSTLQISSNGFVRFAPPNNDSGCCSGRPIPLNDLWNNIIAFAWTDLNPSGALGGRLRWETRGTAPNRRFILHSDSVRYFGGTETNLIQWMELHEGTGVIEIHTQLMTPRVITQGTENATGTVAHFIPGRVATTFSLVNDGVRWTPQQAPPTQVAIHTTFSGPPNRDPGQISLDDPSVFVQVLNIQAFLGRPASPSDVRIGPDWETGTPAEDFVILDINNDGVLDIQLRWSTAQLVADGRLPPVGPAVLTVWGRDPTTGDLYSGTVAVTVIPSGVVIYDNGPFITHPGAGAGGADVHMAATNFLASNARRIGGGPHFRIADRFTVAAGGANVNLIVTRALINDLAQPAWNFYSMNIWDGRPGDPGSNIIASTSTATWAWSGVYAVFQGFPLGGTDFPVFDIYWSTPGLTLAAGNYWIDWQVDGSNAWAIYVTHPNPANPNQPILGMGVGRQLIPDGWQDLLQGEPGVPHTPGTPFLVIGQPGGAGANGPSFRRSDAGLPLTTPQPGRATPYNEPHLRRN
jgi:hypothetical protein